MAELLCSCFQKRYAIEPLIARCFAFVGPFLPLDAHFAIGNFIRDALAGGPIGVRGDGTPFRSYLYAADLVIWLWTILFQGKAMRAYNVGSSHDLTIANLAQAVRACISDDLEIAVAQRPEKVPALRYVPANARAIAELGLREHVGLHEAIKRTARGATTEIPRGTPSPDREP
jgi:dTDP-glucose 4,6-dehydratase